MKNKYANTVPDMKKFLVLFTILLAATMNIMAQKGEKTVGILAGYTTENQSGIAGLFFQYRCNSLLRLSPECMFAIKNDNRSAFLFNGNAHFLIKASEKANFYPLVGITFHNWKYYNSDENNKFRLGGNIGAGFEIMATSTLKLSVEAKYSLVKDFSSGNFYASIGYVF